MSGETFIYTGPNVLALGIERFKLFRGGLPFCVRRAVEKIPEIEKLIVPISELEATRDKINSPGSNEARLFSTVQ
ncbi:MAG: hypothetical protein IJT58_03305, partial [Synergistaceae bacterium]|nr:hypothetical protein [Synergistaceae bacterium]